MKVHALGINPGGEVMGQNIGELDPQHLQYADKLLSKEDLETKLGGAVRWPGTG